MSLKDADWSWPPVVSRSEALFGSPHRLRVALLASLADADELYAARIARHAEIDRKEAVRELAHFEAADLLAPVVRVPSKSGRGRPARFLERRDEAAWKALQALGERYRRLPARTKLAAEDRPGGAGPEGEGR